MMYYGAIEELQQSGRLPEQAGTAHLDFQIFENDRHGYRGVRDGDTITIQAIRGSIFVGGLSGGSQCLVIPKLPHRERWGTARWTSFFGQDENPFHARIDRDAAVILLTEGEHAFYSALKPKKIKALEKAWHVQAQRQGDIWALKTPFSDWSAIVNMSLIERGIRVNPRHAGRDAEVFGTRHHVVGTLTRYNGEVEYGNGTLVQQPDHAALDISNGIFLLMRSAHVLDGGD